MKTLSSIISHLPIQLVVGIIWVYRSFISPVKNALLGPSGCCRFYPTCSDYALQSVKTHGAVRGIFFSILRLGKCHPFHRGGFDPVKPVVSQFRKLPEPESLLDLRG